MSTTPKYKFIINDICKKINNGQLTIGTQMESLNEVCRKYQVSRDTAIKAYQVLKSRGVIDSMSGKGYFINTEKTNFRRRILLLFDEFTNYKNDLYISIKEHLQNKIPIDIFFHHFNSEQFNSILLSKSGKYTDYVIMPIAEPHTFKALEQLNKNGNLYILDQGLEYFDEMPYAFVGQNFEQDLYEGMQLIANELPDYECLIMQIDNPKGFSGGKMVESMTKGFTKFCIENNIPNQVKVQLDKPRKNHCYFIHNDEALIDFIQKCREAQLEIGTDLGIISYNESNLKSVVDKGISTLSTQFNEMGKQLAMMILNNRKEFIKIPLQFTERNSFLLNHKNQ